jgi:hypothetical protein
MGYTILYVPEGRRNMPPIIFRKRLRPFLVWIGLGVILTILGYEIAMVAKPGGLPLNDFIAFWAAGRLNATGGNPYAPDQLLTLQKEVGWTRDEPERIWNPPWTLPLVTPFGMLSYPAGGALWLMGHLAIIFFCADYIWRFYGGPSRYHWLAWIVSFIFYPTLYLVQNRQISALILLGIIGFLHFDKNHKGWLAGICIPLIAIKPPLLYLFWIALIFWVIERRYWSVLLGAGLATLVAIAIELWVNPAVISQYLIISGNGQWLFKWVTPTFGTILRILFGAENIWLQFLPPFAGTIWFLLYWSKHHRTWEWGEQMPLLLLVSLVTGIYVWGYDLVVLLVAVIQVAVWILSRGRDWTTLGTTASYLGINILALILPQDAFLYFWLVPSLILWYWAARRVILAESLSKTFTL